MLSAVKNYVHWIHGQWPAGTVEKLPVADETGETNVPGVYVVGDLRGVPLLKFSADSGAKAVKQIIGEQKFQKQRLQRQEGAADEDTVELAIIGAGVAGYAAAFEAQQAGLDFTLIESSQAFSTIANFPQGKPIYTYPSDMQPEGQLQFSADCSDKEKLLSNLKEAAKESGIVPSIKDVSHIKREGQYLQVIAEGAETIKALRVIIAIGRSGNFNTLDVPGEDSGKVFNRLHDPKELQGRQVLVVGGGDSAVEAAVSIAGEGGKVSLCHRGNGFVRAKSENRQQLQDLVDQGSITLHLDTKVQRIMPDNVELVSREGEVSIVENEVVLSLIGRSAPLDFFRRSGITIAGESKPIGWAALLLFFIAVTALYDWKTYGFFNQFWNASPFPAQVPFWIEGLGDWWFDQLDDRSTFVGSLAVSMQSRSFYYALLYTSLVSIFGWLRIRRRKTPYVTVQTSCLVMIQLLPLFLLPEVLLPWFGYLGFYDEGVGRLLGDNLFPSYISEEAMLDEDWPEWGHPRAYWHAYGLILAWPLSVYNVFTPEPVMGWLIIAFLQTFVLIPLLVYKYGKGAYCGWICSCGALAETLGDTQRHKMPHGPRSNRLNMIGQIFLALAFVMLAIRIGGWVYPESWMNHAYNLLLHGNNAEGQIVNPLSWKWIVDILFASIIGVGFYFKYSGRVWCRFACPLAALMNIYGRFSRFRIFPDKNKCISCNLCTSVCHQGVDVMGFANKGEPMADPQCVRCGACVQTCPTGVLQFGEIDNGTGQAARLDRLQASPVRIVEVSSQTQN